jgi:hypothetical protein
MASPQKINKKNIHLFDDTSRTEGALYNNKVTIISHGSNSAVIVGYLSDPFKWNMSASWKGMFEGFGKFSVIQKSFEVTGEQFLNQGIFTRKIYKGNAYVELPLKFRVTDYNGTGNVMQYSQALANAMLPHHSDIIVGSAINTKALPTKDNVQSGDIRTSKVGTLLDTAGGTIAAILNVGGELTQKNSDMEAALDKAEGPRSPTVSVTVGNLFSNQSMIVESGSVTYSIAQVKNPATGALAGPLYADFDVKLSARSVKPKNQSGVHGKPSFYNVSINR